MPQLCEAIVANQTPYVDTVSGATLTSNAVIEGTGLGFALTSGRLAGANAAAASKSFRPLPKVVRFKA